jgi:putative nucleotidyltransferase with HDIG domain
MTFKKIDLTKLKIDDNLSRLRLAANIYSKIGILIAPKNTRLDVYVIDIILKHGRTLVTVWQADKLADKDFVDKTREAVETDKELSFQKFQIEYKEADKQINEVLDAVRTGRPIDIDKTYEITNTMIENMNNKSDIFVFMNRIRNYDIGTAGHSNHVALISNVFGRWLGLPKDELALMTVGGVLHDAGKCEIPQYIINKPGKLTKVEYDIVKSHAEKGYQMLKDRDMPKDAIMCVYSHHERSDGSGYPLGLRGDEINFAARAVAIVDIFEAMTTNRPYRDAMCPFDVIRTLEVGMYGDLDTELLLVFLKNIAQNYVGGNVVLSDGSEGKVVFINPNNITRPIIQTFDDKFIDLSEKSNVKIVSVS